MKWNPNALKGLPGNNGLSGEAGGETTGAPPSTAVGYVGTVLGNIYSNW